MSGTSHQSTMSVLSSQEWDAISWVLLDMDGTLLDLCFDDTFWRVGLPNQYAEAKNIERVQAEAHINRIGKEWYGQLEWYCIDFWSEQLGFDIRPAKSTLAHLIGFRAGALAFLKWLRHSGRHVILATNAHPDSIALKDTRTDLCRWVDVVLDAHAAGAPKESPDYWQWLQEKTGFLPERTLFIDDNDHILDAAKAAGIRHLVGVHTPNSQAPAKPSRYPAFDHFQELYPVSI
ncbi:GMP/IMP nucleotidase [Reinekea blandensis]|uniref:Probable hydrolase n=1 Tax=Reinekea blandensis MED297 TaxID=314283 RepID=A4BAF8_9GAMM|nr:GMP/IMP nucleotidase [Reinekea blandensis]EAR10914.1 probable hydrolase [Reinekea sp. MED297] [Reinekea blandensis MED297]